MEIVESIVVIIASLVAIWGIIRWRKEEKWKRKYVLAEEALATAYECISVLDTIRRPVSHSGESKDREKDPNESPQLSRALDQAYVIRDRYNRNRKCFETLHSLRFRFKAIYGHKYELLVASFMKILNSVLYASDEMTFIQMGEYDFDPDLKKELLNKNRRIIYSSSKEDPIKKELEIAITELEKVCRKIIDPSF